MGVYLNPKNKGFRTALNSRIYVDKTGLIGLTNAAINTQQKYLCISRPRRFGKTMAANMLTAYYSKSEDSRSLFKGLKIEKEPSFEQHLNKHNVIFMNIQRFLSGAGSAYAVTEYINDRLLAELRKEYGSYIDETEKSLSQALEALYAETEEEFIFIVDEWDCIFREKETDSRSQERYLDFLRNLFKDQDYVSLVYMTGILPIKKYGTHSAINIFREISMTNTEEFAEYVGFTESEVKALCEQYEMDFDEMCRWYDGYDLRNAGHIYNPKSVVDSMLTGEYKSFWTSTETYEALKRYIDMDFDGLRQSVTEMLGGGSCRIDTLTFNNDMNSFNSRDDILTLLVHLGYLAYDADTSSVSIPNEEVRDEFARSIKSSKWDGVIRAVSGSDKLLDATLNGDEEAVAAAIDEAHSDTVSILQYNNENALSCVISLAYYSARQFYTLQRECPAGKGFADIVFMPRKKTDKPAMIVELKWNASAEGAVEQIENKEYVKALKDYRGAVLLVGINYDKTAKKHRCRIKKVII